MPMYYARATRDFVREIYMGALIAERVGADGAEREVAPPTIHRLPTTAGTVVGFNTKKRRDAYVTAINADHPDAVVAE